MEWEWETEEVYARDAGRMKLLLTEAGKSRLVHWGRPAFKFEISPGHLSDSIRK